MDTVFYLVIPLQLLVIMLCIHTTTEVRELSFRTHIQTQSTQTLKAATFSK